MSALRMFIPITKVDAAQRLVYGLATAEIEDRAGEICDYASTKPLYERWSKEIATSSRGKSLGNLRAMHGPVAAGKVTAIDFNDGAKQIEICAKVVDDVEWAKVAEGVYTGFSQGGAYARRWTDADGRTRYTAAPSEISLVDLPCLPQAAFEMIKADGTREVRRFGKALDNAVRLAGLSDELDSLRDEAMLEEKAEDDDSDVPAKLRDLIEHATAILRAMTAATAIDSQSDGACQPSPTRSAPAKKAALLGAAAKPPQNGVNEGEADQTRIQKAHDATVELGASCLAQKSMPEGLEKRFDALGATLADVLQRVKRIEEQPLPLPLAGQARAIGKYESVSSGLHAEDASDKLLVDPDALSVLAIKLAQRNGRAPIR